MWFAKGYHWPNDKGERHLTEVPFPPFCLNTELIRQWTMLKGNSSYVILHHLRESGRGLFQGTVQNLPGQNEKNHDDSNRGVPYRHILIFKFVESRMKVKYFKLIIFSISSLN
jgi:hypothetical protein